MVFIPVRLVTVADPPRISIEETMTFVASLEEKVVNIRPDLATGLAERTRRT